MSILQVRPLLSVLRQNQQVVVIVAFVELFLYFLKNMLGCKTNKSLSYEHLPKKWDENLVNFRLLAGIVPEVEP